MYNGGQQGWAGNPFGGGGVPNFATMQPGMQPGMQQQYQTAPVGQQQQYRADDGQGLDKLDAFAVQGFSKPAQNQGEGGGQGASAPGSPPQPSYSNVPLSRIPPKSATTPERAAAAPVMQPPPAVMAVPPMSMGMVPAGGMYATAMPMQMTMPMAGGPGMYATMGGAVPMPPFATAPPVPLANPFDAPQFAAQQQQQPPAQQQYAQQPFAQQPPPQQQLYGTAQPQGTLPPAGGAYRDPFSTAPPPAHSMGMAMPAVGGGTSVGAPVGGGQGWDPFNTTGGGMAAQRGAPPMAQQAYQTAPVQQQNVAAATAAMGAWDPFSGAPAVAAQQQAGSPAPAAAGWGDLSDADIWGDQKPDPKPAGANGPKSDDEAEWSDDDAASGSSGGRSPGSRGATQEDADYQLALKLQQEEEARARGVETGGASTGSPPRERTSDKPDGEILARISKRTLLVKVWKPTYFIFELPDLLLLYRSREDRLYNPKGTMIKKRVEIKHNHTLTPLKRKFYKDYGYLWHFTVEEQLDYGPSVVVKFGFQDKRPVEELGNRIAEAIREKRRLRARLNQYTTARPQGGVGGSPPPSSIYNAAPAARADPYDSYRSGGGATYGRRADYENGNREVVDKYSKWGSLS